MAKNSIAVAVKKTATATKTATKKMSTEDKKKAEQRYKASKQNQPKKSTAKKEPVKKEEPKKPNATKQTPQKADFTKVKELNKSVQNSSKSAYNAYKKADLNALGTTAKTRSGGSKNTLASNLEKVGTRAQVTGEISKSLGGSDRRGNMSKAERKKALKNAVKNVDWASIDKEIEKSHDTRVSSKDLNNEDYLRMQIAGLMPSQKARKGALGLKLDENGNPVNNFGTYEQGDLADKIARRDAYDMQRGTSSRVAQGVMEGLSYVPTQNGLGLDYTQQQKNAIQEGRDSKAFGIGYGAGVMANYMLTGAGGGLEKGLVQGALKGNSTTFAKNFLMKRGADLVVNSPLNALDSVKMATDVDGNIDWSEAGKNMALNTVLDFGMGGGIDIVEGALKGAQIKKAITIQNKLKSGQTLDASEEKLLAKLTQHSKSGENSGWTKYEDTVKDTTKANGEAKSGVNKYLDNRDNYTKSVKQVNEEAQAKFDTEYERQAKIAEEINANENATLKASNEHIPQTGVAPEYLDSGVSRRDIKKVGDSKIKAYGIEHPELKKYFANEAKKLLEEMRSGTRGEKANMYSLDAGNEGFVMGRSVNAQRNMPPEVERLLDEFGHKYDDIESALESYANGKPKNNAVTKRLEILMDERMRGQSPNRFGAEELEYAVKNETDPELRAMAQDELNSINAPNEEYVTAINRSDIKEDTGRLAKAEGKNAKADTTTKEAKSESKPKRNADVTLDKAKKNLAGAKKHLDRSEKKHGKPSAGAKKHYADAKKALEEAEKNAKKVDKKPQAPRIKDADSPEGKVSAKKTREWVDKSDTVRGRLWQLFGDELSSFERLANKMDAETAKLFRASLNRMRVVKTLNSLSVSGKMKKGLGQMNWKGETVGKSLDDITEKAKFKHLGKRVPSQLDANSSAKEYFATTTKEQDFDYYCRLMSDLDLARKGEDAGRIFDLTYEQELKMVREFRKAYGKELRQYQKDIVKFARNDLQYAIDGGMVQASEAKKWLERNPNYVPAYRSVELDAFDDMQAFDDISVKSGMKKRKGDNDLDLVPLYNSLVARNSKILKQTELNHMLNFVSQSVTLNKIDKGTLKKELSDEEVVNSLSSAVFITKDKQKTSFVHFFDEATGEMKSMPIPNDGARGLASWTGEEQLAFLKFKSVKTVIGLSTKANQMFKNLITGWNPIFGAKNIVRDTQTALINTNYGIGNYIRNYGRAIHQMYTGGDLYKLYKQSGGQFATMVKGETDLGKLRTKAITKPIEALEELNNMMETIPRFAEFCASAEHSFKKQVGEEEFKRLKAQGQTTLTYHMAKKMKRDDVAVAISDAKEVTVNFARSGQIGKLLNSSLVPYFNPALQGLYKVYKKGQESFQKDVMEGLTYITKIGTLGVASGVIFEEVMQGNKDYQQLSSYTKNTYYCIPLGDGHFLKVPKARDLSAVQIPFEHLIRTAQIGTADGDWKEAFKTSWEQIGAVNPFTDNILSGLYQFKTGKNWYGGDIESVDDKPLIAIGKSNQVWDENTSILARYLGNTEFCMKHKISPKKIDNLFDSYMGMVYDLGISQTSISAKEHGFMSPVISNFVIDSVVKNQNGSNFYEEGNKYYNIKNYAEKNGETDSAEYKEAMKWIETYNYPSSTVSQAVNMIQMDENMDGRAKYQKLRRLKEVQNEIQRAGLNGEPLKIDALGECAEILGVERVFGSKEMMHKDEDKSNTYYDAYASMKELPEYVNGSPAKQKKMRKDFYAIYRNASEAEINAGGSTLYPDYTTVALSAKLTNKNRDGNKMNAEVKKLMFGTAFESKQRIINDYVDKYGGNMKTWTKTLKCLHEAKDAVGAEYVNDLNHGVEALALAKGKQDDRAYFITGTKTMYKINCARWANKDGITAEKFNEWYKKNKFNEYTDKDEIVKAINNTSWIDTDRKKAEVYGLAYYYFQKSNAFGSIPAFKMDGDVGVSSGGSGRRGWGHHRRGHHGGGGGGGRAKVGSYEAWLKSHGYGATSTASSTASSLTEAFRKKQLEQLKKTSGTYKN